VAEKHLSERLGCNACEGLDGLGAEPIGERISPIGIGSSIWTVTVTLRPFIVWMDSLVVRLSPVWCGKQTPPTNLTPS